MQYYAFEQSTQMSDLWGTVYSFGHIRSRLIVKNSALTNRCLTTNRSGYTLFIFFLWNSDQILPIWRKSARAYSAEPHPPLFIFHIGRSCLPCLFVVSATTHPFYTQRILYTHRSLRLGHRMHFTSYNSNHSMMAKPDEAI